MRSLNGLFDMVISRDLFDYSEDTILQSVIKSYVGNLSFLEEKQCETIYIITDSVRCSSYDMRMDFNHITLDKHIKLRNSEQFEYRSLDVDGKSLRVLVYDIDDFKSDCIRGRRAETVIVDIYDEKKLEILDEDFICMCLSPINIYKGNKPYHGMILIK